MAKFNEIVYDIREAIKEFSDDTEVDNRHINFLINTKRAKYLRQDLNNFQKTTDTSIQQTFTIELEEVSAYECNQDLYCDKVMRTVKPLPKAIELHTKPAITNIRPAHKLSAPFNLISRHKVPFLLSAPFNRSVYAYLDTDYYVYVVSKSDAHKLIECMTISGIFENPLDLVNYENNGDTCFDPDTTEYPLQPHYIDLIKSEIVNDLLRLKRVPEDKENDSND